MTAIETIRDEKRRIRANRLEAKAALLERQVAATNAALPKDRAFWTQPGNSSRRKAQFRLVATLEKQVAAEALRKQAANLRKPLRQKGDAAKAQAEAAARVQAKKGDWFLSVYGWRQVARVNAKSLSFKGAFETVAVPKHLVQRVSSSNPMEG